MDKRLDVYMRLQKQDPEILEYAMKLYRKMPSASFLKDNDQVMEVGGLGLVRITYTDLVKIKAEALGYMVEAEIERRVNKELRL